LSTNSKNKPPVIALFGPTAAGKTNLIAEIFTDRYEIINADSQQVYRHLSIGTAKPDAAIRKRIPHHLIDIIEPCEQFTVGDFVRNADKLVAEIIRRGKFPLVSGGTAYYIKHFAVGLPQSPKSDDGIRKALHGELRERGKEALYAELLQNDPVSAGKISMNDTYRVLRALEIFRKTGQPLSSFKINERIRSDYSFLFIGLELSREELAERIDQRVEGMFAQGLLEEMRGLISGGRTESDPGMKGIGYREFFSMLKGCLSIHEVKEAIKLHTRQYAKRQMTFFRSLPGTLWFHPREKEKIAQCVEVFFRERKASPDFDTRLT
jgi:tRNA dimethylallyltransferase